VRTLRPGAQLQAGAAKQQPALIRALGAKIINGTACLDIPVSDEFGGAEYKVSALPMRQRRRESPSPQVSN